MEELRDIVKWYAQHKDYADFIKDITFAIGVIATFYGYFKFLNFLAQRGVLNKRQEMENDAKLYGEIHDKLKEHVDSYRASKKNMRDIGIRLLFIKNYPYKLDKDGYSHMLYYYFLSENHQATGYISSTGINVMDYCQPLTFCNTPSLLVACGGSRMSPAA